MGIFSDVLFTADFDRTLSDHHDIVPQRNIDAIRQFMAEGGLFCINSGRSIPLLLPKLDLVPTNAPCLCYNGAACYDFATGKLLYAHPLPQEAPTLLEKLVQSGGDFGVEIQRIDGHYSFRTSSRDPFLKKQGITPISAKDGAPLPWMKLVLCVSEREDIFSASLTDEQERRMRRMEETVERICGETCYVVRSLPPVLEIGVRGCDKGTAARQLADSLGRKVLVCAGDAPNDRQMLTAADHAFVPADADSEMLALAGPHRTVPSGEGCIADAIDQLRSIL